MSVILSCKNVSLQFTPGFKYPDAEYSIRDVSFELSAYESLGIIGSNGAGKSTLLRLLAGVYSPTNGSIECKKNVTAMFDLNHHFHPNLTGYENIKNVLRYYGYVGQDLKVLIKEVILLSGLGKKINDLYRNYSTGMRLRLGFCCATCRRPSILLMDEWIGSGDLNFRNVILKKMNELIDSSSGLIITSHNKNLIKSLCSRVLVLKNGSCIFDGDVDKGILLYEQH